MSKIIINATLTTVQPVSIKLPEQDGHPKITRGVDSDGKHKKTAYIPATTVRGRLRRLAVQPLMQAAAADGKPWTLHQVYDAMLGMNAESEDKKDEVDLVALKKRRQDNHIVDFFGSGLGVKSRLSVGNFVPVVDVEPEKFIAVRKDLDSDTDALELLDDGEAGRFIDRNATNSKRSAVDAVVKQMRRQISKLEKAGQDATSQKAAILVAESERDALLLEMGEMKNSAKAIFSYEAMPAGIELKSRMIIDKATAKDVSTLIGALDLFSRTPQLGGQTARGCGEVTGKFEMLDQDGMSLAVIEVGDYMPSKVSWTASGEEFMRENS